ncbi:MAG: PH domain-containing protein [bacterium]
MLDSTNLPLDRKKIIKKTLEKFPVFLLFLILGGIMVVFGFLLPELKLWWLTTIGIALPIISIICVYIYQVYYYKLYFYDFKDDGAQIRKGVISRSTGHVRYERIQNIYIDQDIMDRIFGLFDVHYETAGETSGIYSHVDGLNKENAEKLVEFLNSKLYGGNKQVNQNTSGLNNNSDTSKATATGEVIDRNIVPVLKRIIIKNTITTTLFSVFIVFWIFGGIFGEEDINISGGTVAIIFLGVIVLAFIGSYIYQKIWFKNFHFQFSDNSGIIKSQVIALSSSYVYYDRIQNVNVTQGIIERLFGLFSVTIETAAESGNKKKRAGLRVPGLSNTGAEKLKDFLLAKVDIYKNRL